MSGKIETPEAMAERLWFAVADADVTPTRLVCMEDAIRARDEQIAAALEAEANDIDEQCQREANPDRFKIMCGASAARRGIVAVLRGSS